MNKVVLDASALLAFAHGERGSEVVKPKLVDAMMSSVNYSEFLKKSIEHGISASNAGSLVTRNRIQILPFDKKQGHVAAELWPAGKPLGLSFADRACLALAISVNGTVYTADKNMADVDAKIKIVLIRKRH